MSESEKKKPTILNHLMIYCNPSDSGNNYWIPHKVQTNKKYTNIAQPCGTSNNTSWNIWESSTLLIECLSVSSLLVCQSTLCLHLPQCSELTCCCLIILCYGKLIAELYISFWAILSSSQSEYLGSLGKYLYRL
jgi:hypothetical protein